MAAVAARVCGSTDAQDAHDLESFLHRAGFDVQVCSQVDKTPSFSSIAALELSPAVIERLRPVLRAWVMTPSLARPQRST